jgi:hypothetical protein
VRTWETQYHSFPGFKIEAGIKINRRLALILLYKQLKSAEIVFAVPNEADGPILNELGGTIALVNRGKVSSTDLKLKVH